MLANQLSPLRARAATVAGSPLPAAYQDFGVSGEEEERHGEGHSDNVGFDAASTRFSAPRPQSRPKSRRTGASSRHRGGSDDGTEDVTEPFFEVDWELVDAK
jgi:hypothetical protein